MSLTHLERLRAESIHIPSEVVAECERPVTLHLARKAFFPPVAVAGGAGLHCSRLDGAPPIYNQAGTFTPDPLICPTALAAEVLMQMKQLDSANSAPTSVRSRGL